MERFPTVTALANADLEDVLVLWKGLGYYTRARNLHRGAQRIAARRGGVLPREIRELRSIPGIGDYTAGAIASIAYGQPCPAVDGNVLRVFSRVFSIEEDIALPAVKRRIHDLAMEQISRQDPGAFNQGLMDLGASICVPIAPKCSECPLKPICLACQQGNPEKLPIKSPPPAKKRVDRILCVVRRADEVLLLKDQHKGLFAGLWEFPGIDLEKGWGGEGSLEGRIGQWLGETFGLRIVSVKAWMQAKHTFTHMQWHMKVYHCEAAQQPTSPRRGCWHRMEELEALAIPTAYQAVIQQIRCTFF
jgi:A/G-specific adenine glycosylase